MLTRLSTLVDNIYPQARSTPAAPPGPPLGLVRWPNYRGTLGGMEPPPAPDPIRETPPDTSPDAIAAVRALVRAARVLEAACAGLSLPHYRVLEAVAEGNERASRVAARLALGKPAISVAVDSLCARGLLSRSEVPGDQRATCLRITEDGTRLLAEVEAAMVGRLLAVTGRTSDPQAVLSTLSDLGPAIDRWREGPR